MNPKVERKKKASYIIEASICGLNNSVKQCYKNVTSPVSKL